MSNFDLLHPTLQHHLISTFGWRSLSPAQEAAISPVLNREDLLLVAPTAGGKTEAAILPLLSRMASEPWAGLSVLYVCPIRALLNNLHPRLDRYARLLGRRAELWHGDVGDSARRRILKQPPDLLLTTPESLEAMLISRRVEHQEVFADVRAIVIDELHAFAGDDRGTHLLALLSRLERLAGRPIQRLGLSATVGNMVELADWLTGCGRAPAIIVSPTAEPPAPPELMLDYVGSLANAGRVIASLHAGEKRLVFCDSRARVEELAYHLRVEGIRTFVSHGALGQAERRQAEEAFSQAQDCVIVATSTLELGLDVGDLDRVIQIDAPSTVAGFLQRLGRSGRRPGTRRNCLFLATDPESFLQAAGLLRLHAQGYVESARPPVAPWHLVAQQIMALVLQEKGLAPGDLSRWLTGFAPFATLGHAQLTSLLHYMCESEILHQDGGLLSFGRRGEREFGKRHFIDLVAAFTTPPLFVVRHGRQEIGQVHHASFIQRDERPPVLLLGGRSWVAKEIDWNARVVWVEPTREVGKSRWEGSSRALHPVLCRAVREVLCGAEIPAQLSRRAETLREEILLEMSWAHPNTTTVIRKPSGRIQWWTFAGLLANQWMASALERLGYTVRSVDNFSLNLAETDPRLLIECIASLEVVSTPPTVPPKTLADLKFSAALPLEMAEEVLALRLSDRTGVIDALAEPIRLRVEASN